MTTKIIRVLSILVTITSIVKASSRQSSCDVQLTKCMRPDYMPKLHSLVDRITIHLRHVAYNVSKYMKIPNLCCTYFMNYDKLKETVNSMCMATTGPDTLDYVVGLFNKVVSEAIDLGCGKYNSVAQCNKLIPNDVRQLEDLVTPDSKVTKQNVTFLIPLIDITKALDEA